MCLTAACQNFLGPVRSLTSHRTSLFVASVPQEHGITQILICFCVFSFLANIHKPMRSSCRYAALLLALCPIQIAAFVPGAGSPCHRRSLAPRSNFFTLRAGMRMTADGDGGAGDDLERVDVKTLAPRRLGGTSGPPSEQVELERRVFEVTRRSALFALSLSTLVGYVKIYGESEESLRLYDSIDAALRRATGRPLAGITQERVRAPLDASFAQLVAGAIEYVATGLQIVDATSLHREELAIAAKAVRLFPVADSETDVSVSQAIQGGDWSAIQHSSPSTSNLALYSRLRALEARLPSPKSRKEFSSAVGARILQQLRARNSDLDAAIEECVEKGARDCDQWLVALDKLLSAFSASGYGVAAIGENGTGLLDRVSWREDTSMTGSLSVFVYLMVFNDAAQVLAAKILEKSDTLLVHEVT